jgi:hypothetical protein
VGVREFSWYPGSVIVKPIGLTEPRDAIPHRYTDLACPNPSAQPPGTLKAWPQWLQEGKPSPTGRHAFTTWRLWKKTDALLDSGLLGPVRLVAAEQVKLPQ